MSRYNYHPEFKDKETEAQRMLIISIASNHK